MKMLWSSNNTFLICTTKWTLRKTPSNRLICRQSWDKAAFNKCSNYRCYKMKWAKRMYFFLISSNKSLSQICKVMLQNHTRLMLLLKDIERRTKLNKWCKRTHRHSRINSRICRCSPLRICLLFKNQIASLAAIFNKNLPASKLQRQAKTVDLLTFRMEVGSAHNVKIITSMVESNVTDAKRLRPRMTLMVSQSICSRGLNLKGLWRKASSMISRVNHSVRYLLLSLIWAISRVSSWIRNS